MPTKTANWTTLNAKPRFAAFATALKPAILGCSNCVRTSTPTVMASLTQRNVERFVNICTNTAVERVTPDPDREGRVVHEEETQIGCPTVGPARKP